MEFWPIILWRHYCWKWRYCLRHRLFSFLVYSVKMSITRATVDPHHFLFKIFLQQHSSSQIIKIKKNCFKMKFSVEFQKFSIKEYICWQWCWWLNGCNIWWRWWQNHYFDDFINVKNRSPTSQTCNRNNRSPTSVT